MYKLRFKQILASVLSAAMLLTAAPVGVLAEEIPTDMDSIAVEDIIEEDLPMSGKTGDITWQIDAEGTLTINGELPNYARSEAWGEWLSNADYKDVVTKIICNVSNARSLPFMSFTKAKEIDLSGMTNTSSVYTFQSAFSGCSSLETIDFGNFDSSNVESTSDMFTNCSALKTVKNIDKLDTKKVKSFGGMFTSCSKLESIDLSKMNTSNAENMFGMFAYCNSLKTLDLSSFDTSKVTDFGNMFAGCLYLENITFGKKFVATSAERTNHMFAGCRALKELDFSSFILSGNTKKYEIYNMFDACNSIKYLDLSKWDLAKVEWLQNVEDELLDECEALDAIDLPKNLNPTVSVKLPGTFVMPDGTEITELPKTTKSVRIIRKGTNPVIPEPKPEEPAKPDKPSNPETPENPTPVDGAVITPVTDGELTVPFAELTLGLTKTNARKGITGNNTITVIPSVSSNNILNKIVWTVGDKSIVSVANGKITAKKAGTTTVTATLKRKTEVINSIPIKVTVSDNEGIVLPKTSISKNAVDVYNINVKGRGMSNAKIDPNKGILLSVLGVTTANKNKVKWTVDDKTIASVSAVGKVIGKKDGEVTVTATLDGVSVNYKVKVNLAAINVTEKRFDLENGKSLNLADYITSVTGSNTNKADIIWMPATAKQNEKISLSPDGVVTARNKGTVNVLAMINGVMVKFTIKIK